MLSSAVSECRPLAYGLSLQRGNISTRVTYQRQGLTLVHVSAQLNPYLTHKNTLHTLNAPSHPLNTGYKTPARTPYPITSAQVELRSGRAPDQRRGICFYAACVIASRAR